MHVFRILMLCLLAIGVAFAPLGSIAHAKGHGSHAVSMKAGHDDKAHKAHTADHTHHGSSKPCKADAAGAGDCCAFGCQVILASVTPCILACERQKPALVGFSVEQYSETHPAGLDPPPRA